jgi:hypothetical protein
MSSMPQPVMITNYRAIIGTGQPIIADATIEEDHDDETTMTDQPVEVGSMVTDHAFDEPAELNLVYAWSLGSPQNTQRDPSFLKNLYQTFLGMKSSRTILTVYTGKRIYQSMLIRKIQETTDKDNENSMTLRIGLRQLLLATTSVTQGAPQSQQSQPDKTSPTIDQGTQSLQPAPNFNSLDQIIKDFGAN